MDDHPPRRSLARRLLGLVWGDVQLGAAWVLSLGLALGFMIGVGFIYLVDVKLEYQLFIVRESQLPEPVTVPPPTLAWVHVLTTAYCPCEICCPGTSDFKTSINRDVRIHPYGIATDPKMIRPRTEIDVPGYGRAMVDDTGGAMRQSAKRGVVHLDLRFSQHAVARKWGRRWMWLALPADSGAALSQRGQLPTLPASTMPPASALPAGAPAPMPAAPATTAPAASAPATQRAAAPPPAPGAVPPRAPAPNPAPSTAPARQSAPVVLEP